MPYLIGIALALAVCIAALLVGFDRERVFYPAMLVVVATYYILFAVMGNSTRALILECFASGLFLTVSVLGFKRNLWLVAVALAGHGLFDSVHHLLIENPGLPVWWPPFCLSFDVIAGGFLAALLARRRVRAS